MLSAALDSHRRRGQAWRSTTRRTTTSSPSPSTARRRATRSTSSTSASWPTAGCAIRDDDDAFVAILTGVGDVYCVGADLKKFITFVTEHVDELAAGGSKEKVEGSQYTMAHSLVAVLRDGATLPDGSEFKLYKPVIAAINGICAAGGMEMMWNTDLRVVADDAWFQLAEPRRGLFPGGGSTVHSARQLSWCNAMEVLLLADRITPERALEMGLVNARRAARPGDGQGARVGRDHLPQRSARGARVQAVGEGEHLPRPHARRSRTR